MPSAARRLVLPDLMIATPIAKILLFFYVFRRVFPIFFAVTVGGSIELGAFDKIARSIDQIASSIRYQAQR